MEDVSIEQETSPLMSPEEAVAYLGHAVSKATLQNWRAAGKGPDYTKIGRLAMYTKEALDEFIMKQTVCNAG